VSRPPTSADAHELVSAPSNVGFRHHACRSHRQGRSPARLGKRRHRRGGSQIGATGSGRTRKRCRASLLGQDVARMNRTARANNDRVTRAETDASIPHPCEMSFRAREKPSLAPAQSRLTPHHVSRVLGPPPGPPRCPSAHYTCSESLCEASRPPHVGPRDGRRPAPKAPMITGIHSTHKKCLKTSAGPNRP
jgi:hypothetical protein